MRRFSDCIGTGKSSRNDGNLHKLEDSDRDMEQSRSSIGCLVKVTIAGATRALMAYIATGELNDIFAAWLHSSGNIVAINQKEFCHLSCAGLRHRHAYCIHAIRISFLARPCLCLLSL